MENSNQPVIINKSSGTWWKVLLGIGAAGAAWFAFSSFKQQNALPPPPDDSEDDNEQLSHSEQYEIDLWKFGILKSGSQWPKLIAKQAKQMGISFSKRLNDVAVDKYVEKGRNAGKIETYFQNAIRKVIIKIHQSPSWTEQVAKKAKENNISIPEQLQKSAIWIVLNELMKPYIHKNSGGQSSGSGQQQNNQQQQQPDGNPDPRDDYNGGYNGVSI